MADIKDWSTTAAGNDTGSPPDFPVEGMLPSSVNNTMRELMAAVKRGRLGVESLTHTDLPKTLTANDAGKFFLVDLSSATADETITLPAEATAGDGWNVTIQLTAVNGFDLLINNDAAATEFTLSTAETTVIPVTDGTSWFNRFVLDGSVVSALSGKQTIWVPAVTMIPTPTNGSMPGTMETQVSQVAFATLDFNTGVNQFAAFQVAFPKGWDEGALSFQVFWSPGASVDTGDVNWRAQTLALSDGESLAQTTGGTMIATDAGPGTADDLAISAESTPIQVVGTPVEGDLVTFRFFRAGASDTFTGTASLIGIKLFFTTNAPTDD